MMATFLSPAVVGITCITPMAPTGLRVLLVEAGFLVALRHQSATSRSRTASAYFLKIAGELVEAAQVFLVGGAFAQRVFFR